ncbi:MAG: 16S rRNA (cytidine(1402)-2'-O)-methyltransferase [Hyphomicrobiaceae bacterium]
MSEQEPLAEREAEDVAGGAARGRIVALAAAELERRLAEPLSPGLYLVATPIGNLGDMTLRAIAVLARVDVVCCEDTRHSRTLLAHFGIDRPLRAYHEHNAEAERPGLVAQLQRGRAIALISDAGTPLVSDPGFKLVRDCQEAGILVTAVPGASAVLTAVTMAGLPLNEFHYVGFLPSREGRRRSRLEQLAAIPASLVVFEAPSRLAETLADMAEVLGRDRPVAVARELTKRFEEVRRGSAAEVAAWAASEPVRGEVVIVVGPPLPREATNEAIAAALSALVAETGLKEAVKVVAARLDVPRTRVYEIGLSLKERTRDAT